jgi:hypothetical protein
MIVVARRGTAAEFGQEFPGLEGGDGPFSGCPVASVVAVDLLLIRRQRAGPTPERDGDGWPRSAVGVVGVTGQVTPRILARWTMSGPQR